MGSFIDALRHYADFSGRSSRRAFGLYHLQMIALGVVIGLAEDMMGLAPADDVGLLTNLYLLVMLLPTVSICVRRLHDMGYGGGWVALTLVPLVGFVVYPMLFAWNRDDDNEYGPLVCT